MTFSEMEISVQNADITAALSQVDRIESMLTAIRLKHSIATPFNQRTIMPIEQTMIAILDMQGESNVWELMRSWNQGAGPEAALLSTLEGFLLPDCNEVLKQYFRALW